MDANLVYGWLLQNLEWKEYATCNTIIAQGLQLEDIEYTDLFLEIAQEIAQLTKDDASYREWKAQYGKKRAALKRMQASILPLPREAYQDAKPNKPCPCGSGKKFKACCGKLIKKLDA
ncbi:MAG: SEC-C metal-binding domain-containing protein [Clostridium sp.]